jgi:hypothetical protein
VADLIVTGTGAAVPSSQAIYHVMTELEAVNIMLGTIGEQPVNSLDISTISEVSIASDMLYEVSREVQTRGWSFNEEDEYDLTPSQGEIPVPPNALKVVVNDPSGDYWVRRGTRLYNRTDHTYSVDSSVTAMPCTIVFFLPFTDLPQTARTYIALRTARKFQERIVGSTQIEKFTEIEENQAWINLLAEEVDQGKFSMVDNKLRQNRG